MSVPSDQEIDLALAAGETEQAREPRAKAVGYDRQLGRVIVELTNGCTFVFPPRLVQGLGQASDEQLAQVAILGSGHGLQWGAIDVDVSVPGLLQGLLGTAAYMARRAGQASSPAKAAAARANGAKGGRPRKTTKAA